MSAVALIRIYFVRKIHVGVTFMNNRIQNKALFSLIPLFLKCDSISLSSQGFLPLCAVILIKPKRVNKLTFCSAFPWFQCIKVFSLLPKCTPLFTCALEFYSLKCFTEINGKLISSLCEPLAA